MRRPFNLVIVFLLVVGLTATVQVGWTAGAAPAARLFDSPLPDGRTIIHLPFVAREAISPTPTPTATPPARNSCSIQASRPIQRGEWSCRAHLPGTARGWCTVGCAVCAPVSTALRIWPATRPVTRMSSSPPARPTPPSVWWHPITAEAPLTAAAAAAEPAPELVQAVVDGVLPEGVLAGDLQYAVLADQSGNVLQTFLWTRSNARAWRWASYPVSKSLIGRTGPRASASTTTVTAAAASCSSMTSR